MKKVIICLMVAVVGVFSAAYAADMKIGVIDVRRIMQESAQVKKINTDLQNTFKARQEKIIAKQKALEGQVAKLKRDEAVLSEKDKVALRDQIMRDRRDLERQEQDYQQDLTANQNKAMQAFFGKLRTLVNQLAEKGHYDLILQKDTVPYVNEKGNLDLTKQVLEALS